MSNEKEKAEELFYKYLKKVGTNCEHESYCDNAKCQYKKNTVCCVDLFTAKQCALIAVYEIIKSNPHKNEFYTQVSSTISYWKEVKQEIKKL